MAPKIENLKGDFDLVVAPHWDPLTQSLYFADMTKKTINRYVPSTGKYTNASTGGSQPSIIIPVEGEKNHFVITLNREVVIISWDGESPKFKVLEKLPEIDSAPDLVLNRVNDGKCDPQGKLWAGTISTLPDGPLLFPKTGSLYSFDYAKKVAKSHKSNIAFSNGLAWNVKENKFFYIDSATRSVERYNYDSRLENISNGETWFSVPKHIESDWVPDGMTIDTDGNLYVATLNGGRILKIDGNKPETLLDTINMPPEHITSFAFAGKNYDELYVTTATLTPEQKNPEIDGCLYRITGLGVKGLPAVNFKK